MDRLVRSAMMDLCHMIIPRKKRYCVLLLILLLASLAIALYITKYHEVVLMSSSLSSLSSSTSKSRPILPHDEGHMVIHTVDHGCYLQTSNFTHHRHSPRLLSERNCEQKIPVALIVGGALCGTVTLKSALSFHPDIAIPESDPSVFHENDSRDKDRYLAKMPFSLPNQITVDESQEYVYIPNSSKEFAEVISPKVKIIALVRDPVARAMSEYLVLTSPTSKLYYRKSLSYRGRLAAKKNETYVVQSRDTEIEHEKSTKMKRHVRKQTRKERNHKKERQKSKAKNKNKHHRNKRGALIDQHKPKGSPSNAYKSDEISDNLNDTFERTVLARDYQINGANFLLQRSIYVIGLKKWRKFFPNEKILVLDAEAFARSPADTLTAVEKFLGLQPYFRPEFFDFDLPSGKLCFNSPVRSCVDPIAVRQPHPVLADSLVSELREYFVPWIKIQNRFSGTYFPHLGEHPLVFTPFR